MVIIRVLDKRTLRGYRLKFFQNENVTDEIVRFVKRTKRAYWVQTYNQIYYSREEFLEVYDK